MRKQIIPFNESAIRWHLQSNVMPTLTESTIDKIVADIKAVNSGKKKLSDTIGNSDCTISEMLEDLRINY